MRAWEMKHQAALAGWAERVRECRSSGEPVTTWCEEQGIDRRTYYRWEQEVLKAAEKSRALAAQTEFVELAPRTQKQQEENARAKIRVRVGQTEVDVYPGADLDLVGALCRVLGNVE